MKLSKVQSKLHQQAVELLKQEVLSFDDKIFVLENWQEGATHINSVHGAFFTPFELAKDFSIEINARSTIDLCAGIGMLAFIAVHHAGVKQITCIDVNPAYVEVGRKIVPEATWICGSILDDSVMSTVGKFAQAISNPPFGRISADDSRRSKKYTGADFEFKAIEVASTIAKAGIFILPQMSTPFKYSGEKGFSKQISDKYEKFRTQTGIEFEFNCGIDTATHKNDWRGVSPICEIVLTDFTTIPQGQLQLEM